MMKHVYLCGLMGSGKTTVGRLLAERLGASFFDLDAEIEREAGLAIADIFARQGETDFRGREARALFRLAHAEPAVVALGGGALLRRENRDLVLATGTLVWLDAPSPELVRRIGDVRSRPLLAGGDPAATLERLREERMDDYQSAALRVDTFGSAAAKIADHIFDWLKP